MLAFMINMIPFLAIFQIFCFFQTDQEKCAVGEISTKNEVICDTESINMWILADKTCHFNNFFQILCHDDVITISY